ncbi:MAG: hypothetical protein AAGF07_02395 [Patescibacteria group bacterium]
MKSSLVVLLASVVLVSSCSGNTELKQESLEESYNNQPIEGYQFSEDILEKEEKAISEQKSSDQLDPCVYDDFEKSSGSYSMLCDKLKEYLLNKDNTLSKNFRKLAYEDSGRRILKVNNIRQVLDFGEYEYIDKGNLDPDQITAIRIEMRKNLKIKFNTD